MGSVTMEMERKNGRGNVVAWWVGILLAFFVSICVWDGAFLIWCMILVMVFAFVAPNARVSRWIVCAILVSAAVLAHFSRDLFDDAPPESPVVTAPAKPRDVNARIARAKNEVARVTEKYGKNGKLPITAWALRPEVALPPVLALLEEELEEFDIKRDEQIAAIEAAPEKFRIGVPGHWRKRFMLLTSEQEKTFGDRVEREFISDDKIYHDPAFEARVHQIVERLWKVLPEGTPRRIFLIVDDTVNAFCLANGTVCINSGALKKISSDDVIAFLLAHEYAHYLARHSGEKVTKQLLALAGDVLAERKQMEMEKEGKTLLPLLLRLGYAGGDYAGVYLPFSRRMENEADALGIRYMARAGFDPSGAIEFFAQQEKLRGIPGWEKFLSTHPTDRKRLERMRKECAKIRRAAKKAQ